MSADKVTADQPFVPEPPPLSIKQELSWSQLYQDWQDNDQQPVVLVDVAKKRKQQQKKWLRYQQKSSNLVKETSTIIATPSISFDIPSSTFAHKSETSLSISSSEIVEPLTTSFKSGLNQVHQQISRLNWLQISSNFALSAAVALFLLFGGPIVILETQSLISRAMDALVIPSQVQNNHLEQFISLPTAKPEPKISSAEDVFSLSIPTLDIKSEVIPNIDPSDSAAYTQALKQGVAHAAGTGLPDQLKNNKTIYLFAHSTDAPWNILRYNAEFYALKDINPGEKINLRFWGKDYQYTVSETKVIEAQDVTALEPQQEQEQLILQTCYPPGTTQKRLLVIATPSASLEE